MTMTTADLSLVPPEDVGLGRLDRLSRFFRADTDAGRLPGAVIMIARRGRVAFHEAFGMRDPSTGDAMRPDSIFRIYSMTKPVTGVAVLMLVQDGRLLLSDPVSKYLPALRNPKVAVERPDGHGGTITTLVPADREITVQDVLCHTSGYGYGRGTGAADRALNDAGLGIQLGPDSAGEPLSRRLTDQQVVEALGQVPLLFHPGTRWEYGRSTDIALALVEAVSGERADMFLQRRLFDPLGMVDTTFNLSSDKLHRVAQPGPDPDTGETAVLTDVTMPRTFLGGGEGLLSTAPDYMRFALMLAQGGVGNGVRLLSRRMVTLMTADHIGPALAQGAHFTPGPGYGFGLTVGVRTHPGLSVLPGSVGEFNWGGAAGTAFWVDPREELVPILLIQAPGQRLHYRYHFRSLVYQGIDD